MPMTWSGLRGSTMPMTRGCRSGGSARSTSARTPLRECHRSPPSDRKFGDGIPMTSLAKVPCTIVTGFLGAGKTTLVRHVLENAGGRRLAVIVNEFGDIGIDGEILKSCGIESCPEERIVELSNGCICCTVADDFVPALRRLLDHPAPPEHIVIETSGLALPKPLVQAFNWPEIASRVTVDGVVEVENGRVSPTVLLGLGVAAEDDIANRFSHHDAETEHDHDDFESFVINLRRFEAPQTLVEKIAEAAAKHDILRVKGFVEISGKPMRLLIQGVGSRIQHRFDRAWQKDENRRSRLVVIGQKGLDTAAIRNLIQD